MKQRLYNWYLDKELALLDWLIVLIDRLRWMLHGGRW